MSTWQGYAHPDAPWYEMTESLIATVGAFSFVVIRRRTQGRTVEWAARKYERIGDRVVSCGTKWVGRRKKAVDLCERWAEMTRSDSGAP